VDDKRLIPDLCMPGADALARRIKACLSDHNTKPAGATKWSLSGLTGASAGGAGGGGGVGGGGMGGIHGGVGTSSSSSSSSSSSAYGPRAKPVFTATIQQKLKTRAAHDIMTKHIASVADMAVAHQKELLDRRRAVLELANQMTGAGGSAPRMPGPGVSNQPINWAQHEDDTGDDDEDDGLYPFTNNSSRNFNRQPTSNNGSGSGSSSLATAAAAAAVGSSSASHNNSANSGTQWHRGGSHGDMDVSTSSAGGGGGSGSSSGAGRQPQQRRSLVPQQLKDNVQALTHPGVHNKMLLMSKQPLEGNNTQEFLNRFILTQVCSCPLFVLSCLKEFFVGICFLK
jgi:hypothetical protein